MGNFRKNFEVATGWFSEKYMSFSPTTCHDMCLGKNKENGTFNFENISLKIVVTLGLTIDNKLSFDNQVKKICRKAIQKTCALSRKSPQENLTT